MPSVNAPLFFVSNLPKSETIEIIGDDAHHALKVLRLKVDDFVEISDGFGKVAIGRIIETNRKNFSVKITQEKQQPQSKIQISIAQAIVKSDRTKEMLELITQSGVHELIPWSAEYSIGKWQTNSRLKWQTSVYEAAKQCHIYSVPSVQEVSSTKQLIEKFTDYDQVILLDQNAEDPISKVYKIGKSKILLIIGPEGGVSDAETAQFKNTNVFAAKLANSTFRSAHVALAATSAINTLAGNW